jgi:hypothetical protein
MNAVRNLQEASATELKTALNAATALGKTSPLEIVEAAGGYAPSDDDYSTWLGVIEGFANENGININVRSNFLELAHLMWENDPVPPPHRAQTKLATALWTMYKAKREKDRAAQHFPAGQAPVAAPAPAPVDSASDHADDEDEEIDLNQPQTASDVADENKSAVHGDPVDAALTAPKHSLDDRIKEFERDGERSWDQVTFVDCPHPRDSLAWKAWHRGHRRAAASHFGFRERPEQTTGRSKRKR